MNPVAARAAVGFALGIPAILLEIQGGRLGVFGIVLACIALIGARRGDRFASPLAVRLVAQIAAAGVLVLLAGPFIPALRSGGFGAYVTIVFGALALPRLFFVTDRLAQTITLGMGLLSLMGLARVASKPAFGIAVATYLGASVVATLARDPSAPRMLRHGRRTLGPLAVAFGLAGLTMAGIGVGLPAAEPAVSRALSDYIEPGDEAVSGFGDGRIELGSLREIVTSDAVVMRVYDEAGAVDHLRGQVYVDYEVGRWARRRRVGTAPVPAEHGVLALGSGVASGSVVIEATHDVGRAYFAPLGAATVEWVPDDARRDAFGVAIPPTRVLNDDRNWKIGTGAPAQRILAPPDLWDDAVPRWLRGEITDLARAWVGDAQAPRARVDALVTALGRFEYSLELDRAPDGVDPIVHFLTTARRGHCEYFASAFVLLARASGIPARLVSGYRVFEYNPVGRYHVVRKRDAHAWAEVWLDGTWHTVDPTPPGSLEGESARTAGWWSARWDLVRRFGARLFERLAGLTLVELVVVALGLAGLALLWTWVRRRRVEVATPEPRALAALTRLEAHLVGTEAPARAQSQPLAAYAEVLREAARPRAAALLSTCSALLYGKTGEVEALSAEIEAYIAAGGGEADQ